MYWTDTSTDSLWRADLDGGNQTQLLTGLNFPNGLAMDVANGWLYYAENSRISRLDVVGLGTEVVVDGVSQPYRIALDPIRQLLFWQQGPSVFQVDVVTGEISPVLNQVSQMESLTVDPYGGQLYWNKYNYFGEIWQASLSGSDPSLFRNGVRTPTHLAWDLLGDNLLWFDYITTGGPEFRLRSGNTILENPFVNPKALAVCYLLPTPV
jgi:hypothetical protein